LRECIANIQTHPPSPPQEETTSKSIRRLLEEEITWLTERREQLGERLARLKEESLVFITNLECMKIH